MKRLLVVSALIAIPSIALPAKNHAALDRPATNADILRAWTFSRCLLYSYKGIDQFAADDAATADDFYMGISAGDFPYDKLDPIAKEAAKRRTSAELTKMHSDNGPETVDHHKIVDCLEDAYESPKLKALVKSLK